MGTHTLYTLHRDYPRRLTYRAGEVVVLEIVEGTASDILRWKFQARKVSDGTTWTLAGARLSKSSLEDMIFVGGFEVMSNSPGKAIMRALAKDGFAKLHFGRWKGRA